MNFSDDIVFRLVALGVCVLGSSADVPNSIYSSSNARIPPNGNGPTITVIETGGVGPTRVQNKTTPNTRRPTAQLFVKGNSSGTTYALALAAMSALDGTFNTVINGTTYLSIKARQEPTDIGLDPNKIQYVFNLEAEKS